MEKDTAGGQHASWGEWKETEGTLKFASQSPVPISVFMS